MAFPIAMPSGIPMSAKRVEVVYTHNYLFIGPIASWFGGAFTSVPIRGVAIMRDEVQCRGAMSAMPVFVRDEEQQLTPRNMKRRQIL
jgi:hypothetical protein